jgi:hypothetical protein
MPLRPLVARLSVLALAAALGTPAIRAFEGERPAAPARGEIVSSNITFYIEASGRPLPEEYYRIEIGLDSDFDRIVATFDGKKEKVGWLLGDSYNVSDVPEKYRPTNYQGIHYRVNGKLQDGTYFWRAQKAQGNGAWVPLDGVQQFTVDTRPPAPVDTLRLRRLPDGTLQLWWSPVMRDMGDDMEQVAGYRVYRYDKTLKRYPMMTRYMAQETTDTTAAIAPPPNPEDASLERIVYYLVNAVDQVGNEEGRRRPLPIGDLENTAEVPNLDELTDPNYLRQLNRAERSR